MFEIINKVFGERAKIEGDKIVYHQKSHSGDYTQTVGYISHGTVVDISGDQDEIVGYF